MTRRRIVAEQARRFWGDLVASTDASLLGVLRFVGLLYGPIETGRPIGEAFRAALRRRLPAHAGWKQALGGITYLLFIILVATGVLLSFYYRPSAEQAYQSMQHIVSGVTFGWLMREMHRWAANLIVVAVLAHMARVFFSAAYKPPRETNWLVGLLLLLVVFTFGATGYLLPWDQVAYWTTTEGVDVVGRVPLIGAWVADMLRGDPIVSGATISRFFAIHVILLPWAALGLLMLHFTLLRKHGIAPPSSVSADTPLPPREGVPFFPHHLLRSIIVTVLVIAITITAAVLWPRDVAPQADPAHPPLSVHSTWIVAVISRAIFRAVGAWGFTAFLLLALGLAVLPLFDRDPERRLRRRPVAAGVGLAFFVLLGVLLLSARIASAQGPSDSTLTRSYTGYRPDADNRCVVCHAAERESAVVGVHSENGVRCVDCHGGDPTQRALPAAHSRGFTGKLGKMGVARLCGSCHSDPNKMRGYGLPTGQLAEFRTSRHGQLLFGRNDDAAPTCTDCHGTHIIYPPHDARSRVYPTNIPGTCGHCHDDAKLMGRYGLKTGQLEVFRASAHGRTLFDKQDFAAPTCVACHGAHSALPPTRSAVSNVCGTCHQLVTQAFNAGPHGAAARDGRIRGCLACHSNHATERLADDSIAASCDRCHASDTRLHQVGVDLQRRMTQATSDLRSAGRAVERLTASGQQTSDARFRYQSALTDYLQIASVQHSLDLDRVETLEGRVNAASIELDRMAGAGEEIRWEHKLLLAPVWFLSLSAVTLAGLTLRGLRNGRGAR